MAYGVKFRNLQHLTTNVAPKPARWDILWTTTLTGVVRTLLSQVVDVEELRELAFCAVLFVLCGIFWRRSSESTRAWRSGCNFVSPPCVTSVTPAHLWRWSCWVGWFVVSLPSSFTPSTWTERILRGLWDDFVGTDSVSLPLFLTKTSGGQVALALSTFWHARWFTRMLNLITCSYLLPTFVSHAHTLFCPPFFPQRHLVTSIYSMAHGAVIETFLVASRYRYIPNTLGRKRSRWPLPFPACVHPFNYLLV